LTASEKAANEQLPSPFEPLENITAKFASKGLDIKDVVVLSGSCHLRFLWLSLSLSLSLYFKLVNRVVFLLKP